MAQFFKRSFRVVESARDGIPRAVVCKVVEVLRWYWKYLKHQSHSENTKFWPVSQTLTYSVLMVHVVSATQDTVSKLLSGMAQFFKRSFRVVESGRVGILHAVVCKVVEVLSWHWKYLKHQSHSENTKFWPVSQTLTYSVLMVHVVSAAQDIVSKLRSDDDFHPFGDFLSCCCSFYFGFVALPRKSYIFLPQLQVDDN